jgi:hypothetical protein
MVRQSGEDLDEKVVERSPEILDVSRVNILGAIDCATCREHCASCRGYYASALKDCASVLEHCASIMKRRAAVYPEARTLRKVTTQERRNQVKGVALSSLRLTVRPAPIADSE